MDKLFHQMQAMKLDRLQSAIRASPHLLHTRDWLGRTLLFGSGSIFEGKSVERMAFLIDQGLDLDDQENRDRKTVLHQACSRHDSGVVDLLLTRGANITLTDRNGCTPLMIASKFSKDVILDLLLQHGGNDLNAVNNEGRTALHLSAIECYDKVVTLLITAGADPTIQDNIGMTPLAHAQRYAEMHLKRWRNDMNDFLSSTYHRQFARLAEYLQVGPLFSLLGMLVR